METVARVGTALGHVRLLPRLREPETGHRPM
jgi:hypothetical protein